MGAANPCQRRNRDEAQNKVGLESAPMHDGPQGSAWCEANSLDICSEGEEHVFKGKAVLLSTAQAPTTIAAMEKLNSGFIDCPDGFCIVHSMTRGRYILLWAEGMQRTAMQSLGMDYEVSRINEKKRRAAAKGEYVVAVDRTGGATLGAQCEPDKWSLIIRGLVDSGLMCQWNEANPNAVIAVDDRIVEVNGVRGSSDALIDELKQAKPHVICLLSAKPAAPIATVEAPRPQVQLEVEREMLPEREVRLSCDSDTALRAEQDEIMEFEIAIDKTCGTSLGLGARPDNNVLVVDTVKDGLVAAWNEANPNCKVQHGDRVVEINGVHGSADGLIAQCRENKVLKIRLLRDIGPASEL